MVKYWTRERHRYIVILIPFPALRTKETNAGASDHPEGAPGKQFEAVTGSSLQDYTDEHRFSQGEFTSSSSSSYSCSSRVIIFHRLNAICRSEKGEVLIDRSIDRSLRSPARKLNREGMFFFFLFLSSRYIYSIVYKIKCKNRIRSKNCLEMNI